MLAVSSGECPYLCANSSGRGNGAHVNQPGERPRGRQAPALPLTGKFRSPTRCRTARLLAPRRPRQSTLRLEHRSRPCQMLIPRRFFTGHEACARPPPPTPLELRVHQVLLARRLLPVDLDGFQRPAPHARTPLSCSGLRMSSSLLARHGRAALAPGPGRPYALQEGVSSQPPSPQDIPNARTNSVGRRSSPP